MSAPTLAEVDAGVRRAIAAYTQALDDGRTEDVVATFCPDGVVQIPGRGTHEGHDALRAAYAGWAPRQPQRHVVVNTHVVRWDGDEAEVVSDMLFFHLGAEGWVLQLVGRYDDVLHHADGTWRFHRRRASFVTGA